MADRKKSKATVEAKDVAAADAPLYVPVERVLTGLRWRFDDYGAAGALNAHQCAEISSQFRFSTDEVVDLSLKLGFVLDIASQGRSIEVNRQAAGEKAQKAMKAGQKVIMDVATNLSRGIKTLEQLDTSSATNAEWSARFRAVLLDWDNVINALEDIHRKLDYIANENDVAYDIEIDRRNVRDLAREQVFDLLFTFWKQSGRRITYSTDATTDERRGDLLDFAQTITRFLLLPVTKDEDQEASGLEEPLDDDVEPGETPARWVQPLSKDAIVREIRRFKGKKVRKEGSDSPA